MAWTDEVLTHTDRFAHASSFRDPAGFVFLDNGIVKRAVTQNGKANYELTMSSGLYEELTRRSLLIPHHEEQVSSDTIHKVLIPELVPHISYPYEWSFGQLKDAALLTLEVQSVALRHGMSLKDASAFNIQFRGPRAVFIDTLSFEEDRQGPWVAYGQFCMHFLAPLALMSKVAISLGRFSQLYLDGLPLDLASKLLPASTWLRPGLLMHLHLHARTRQKYSKVSQAGVSKLQTNSPKVNKDAVIQSLQSTIEGLALPSEKTEWIDYYEEAGHYSNQANEFKRTEVLRLTAEVAPNLVYDLGGNIGNYSRLLTAQGISCVCYDIDPLCVDENYRRSKKGGDTRMLPLLLDLTNPTPALGFDLAERDSWRDRSHPDMVLALALIHHLRITGNIPLAKIARAFARLAPSLLIEYVPKQDIRAAQLIGNRPDIFHDYTYEGFLSAFGQEFRLERSVPIPETERLLCLFRKHP